MKKLRNILIGVLLFSLLCMAGCSKSSSNETSEPADSLPKETASESQKETEDEASAETEATETGESTSEDNTQQAEITGPVLVIGSGSKDMKLISTESKEDGYYCEILKKDDILTCKIERYGSPASDIGVAVTQLAYNNGWDDIVRSENAELSERLGCEVYDISFLDEEDGYSIAHKGIYIKTDKYDYFMDFSAIEGDFYNYEDVIQTCIDTVDIFEA